MKSRVRSRGSTVSVFLGELDGQHHVLPCTRAVGAHPDPCSPLFPVLGPVDDVPDQLHKLRVLWSPGQARAGRGHTGNRGTCETFHRGFQSCRLWPPAAVADDHSPVVLSCCGFPYSAGSQESETGFTGLESGCQQVVFLEIIVFSVILQIARPTVLDEAIYGRHDLSLYHLVWELNMGKGNCIGSLKFAELGRGCLTYTPAFPLQMKVLIQNWNGRVGSRSKPVSEPEIRRSPKFFLWWIQSPRMR